MKKHCRICGKEYNAIGSVAYCSEECRKIGVKELHRSYTDYIKYCRSCGRAFSNKSKGRYCEDCLSKKEYRKCSNPGCTRSVAPGLHFLCLQCWVTDGDPDAFYRKESRDKRLMLEEI